LINNEGNYSALFVLLRIQGIVDIRNEISSKLYSEMTLLNFILYEDGFL